MDKPMTPTPYNPVIHHRRSIRLKGHDYAGGGVYFVTICGHRQAGNIFAPPSVKAMVAREWESAAASVWPIVGAGLVSAQSTEGRHADCPYVIMPDHFHALIRMPRGAKTLGDVICAFKSRVVHQYIAGVKTGQWPRFNAHIWHRNYYEMIVWEAEAEKKIAEYIHLNPWRCVMDFGNGLRGMGNPTLWQAEKLGVLCSRGGAVGAGFMSALPRGEHVVLGGFHSPMEKEIFAKRMELKKPLIWCPAWGLDRAAFAPGVRTALEENRMLILEMTTRDGDLASAEARNRFVLKNAERLWLPHVTPGGMLDRLVREMAVQEKIINHGTH